MQSSILIKQKFQHTAARRRLAAALAAADNLLAVSTHSRPKAAGHGTPPKRGRKWFQHTAARRRLGVQHALPLLRPAVSTHSRPKAAGV